MGKNLLYDAICKGKTSLVNTILNESPNLLNEIIMGKSWLNIAAAKNNLSIMEIFVNAGIMVDTELGNEAPINTAADNGSFEALCWLVSNNANVNGRKGKVPPLVGAIQSGSLEMVSFLIANGANTDFQWGQFEYTPLTFAKSLGPSHEKIVDLLTQSNSVQVQHTTIFDDIETHLLNHYGKPAQCLVDMGYKDHPIKVFSITFTGDEPCTVLCTAGMGANEMNAPSGAEDYRRAELMMYLPANWSISGKNPKDSWPIEWLLRISRYPFENDTWLGVPSAIFANEEPPQPLASNTKLSCLLTLCNPGDHGCLIRKNGQRVQFYSVYPIYTEERDFCNRHGATTLLERFAKHNISAVIDLTRINVARI